MTLDWCCLVMYVLGRMRWVYTADAYESDELSRTTMLDWTGGTLLVRIKISGVEETPKGATALRI